MVNPETSTYHLHLTAGFNFRIGSDQDYWSFSYNVNKEEASISRAELTLKIDEMFGYERKATIKDLTTIDIFVDNSFVEIYLNEGEKVFSFRVFQQQTESIYSLDQNLIGMIYHKKFID